MDLDGGSSTLGNTGGRPGIYGTLGTLAAGNIPGGRYGSATWIDNSGHLWLFAGCGYDVNGVWGEPSDLWEFSPAANEWTWMGGSSSVDQPGTYGTLGTPDAGSFPGGRNSSVSWTDNRGNFWLFGGNGFAANYAGGYLNDLWEFNPSTNQWTWWGGSKGVSQPGVYGTLGTSAADNIPGARYLATKWTDSSGNLWLFGGFGYDSEGTLGRLNDLWEYSTSTNEWEWISGSNTIADSTNRPGVYGTLSTPSVANVPGARDRAASWTDNNGKFWLFGGEGYDSNGQMNYLNDLWKFNQSTNEWAWMGGSSTANQSGVYGTMGVPAAENIPGSRELPAHWTDSSGNFWLSEGGNAKVNGSTSQWLSDLWVFNPSSNEWSWMGGSTLTNQSGVYGTLSVPDYANFPGSRGSALYWTDKNSNLWLFGGNGFDSAGNQNALNDLWVYQLPIVQAPIFSLAAGTYTTAQKVDIIERCCLPRRSLPPPHTSAARNSPLAFPHPLREYNAHADQSSGSHPFC